LDGSGSSRRRGSHSEGAWYDSFIRTKTQPVDSPTSSPHVATRKRPFNMFGTKGDPWLASVLGLERPSSPRQGSTQSGEGLALPRPSAESQGRFGWNVDTFGARSSPLGVDWSVGNTNTTSWSRMPSRRPSIQRSSPANLSNNEDMRQDDVLDFPSNIRSPTQAPIGTRPQSSASHMPGQPSTYSLPPIPPTPPTQLNPAAASFNMFQFGKKTEEDKAERAKRTADKVAEKEAKKAEKAEKREEKAKQAKAEKEEKAARRENKHAASEASDYRDTTSPQTSRISRDTPSISTADLSEASPRTSLERTISHSASDKAGSIGKESFMQKITRKGSTSQFLTFSKKNALFSKSKNSDVPGTPDEADESNGFLSVERAIESAGNSPNIGVPKDRSSVLSWGSIKRIGKKDKTPSLHDSIASEATTGDEDDVFIDSAKAKRFSFSV